MEQTGAQHNSSLLAACRCSYGSDINTHTHTHTESSGTTAPHHTTTTCVRQSDGVGCLSVAARRALWILNVAHAISKSHSRYFILLPSDFKNLSTIIAVLFHAQRRRSRSRRRTTTTTITTPPKPDDDGGGRCVDALMDEWMDECT